MESSAVQGPETGGSNSFHDAVVMEDAIIMYCKALNYKIV